MDERGDRERVRRARLPAERERERVARRRSRSRLPCRRLDASSLSPAPPRERLPLRFERFLEERERERERDLVRLCLPPPLLRCLLRLLLRSLWLFFLLSVIN